jgi:hypothetical protein
MTLSEAYKKVKNGNIAEAPPSDNFYNELANSLEAIVNILRNKPHMVKDLGKDKFGDWFIEKGQKIKSL